MGLTAFEWGLIGAALALGLAGIVHCAAMCAAPCAAATGPGLGAQLAFLGGRTLGYAMAGALSAAAVEALGSWAQLAQALQPLRVLMYAGLVSLGLWVLWQGRIPAPVVLRPGNVLAANGPALPAGWARMAGPARGATIGTAWVMWPCGLLHSALALAALTGRPQAGALAMTAFALASAPGLWGLPWLWRRLPRALLTRASAARAAGALLALSSAWALWQASAARVLAWCGL